MRLRAVLLLLAVTALLVAAFVAGSGRPPLRIGNPNAHCTPLYRGLVC